MKREFKNPTMKIAHFNRENVVTTSANFEDAKRLLKENNVSIENTNKVRFGDIVVGF